MIAGLSKPVLVAGFSFLLGLPAALAQDYIDVEAEREAARGEPALPGGATSAPVGQPATTTPDYSGGIRPYSGTTVAPAPVIESTGSLGSSGAATGTPGAVASGSLVLQVQQLEAEVRRLNGIVEEQAQAIRELRDQGLERYVDIDRRLAAMGAGTAIPGGAGADTGGMGSGTASTAAPTGPSGTDTSVPVQPGEEAAYQAAYQRVRERQFGEAVEAFKGFLTDYPFGRFAPNAHYWLGELYLVIEPPDPELARQSFKLLLDQYPGNTKVPDALYKLGRVQFLKGNRERSREYLDRVIRDYGPQGHPAAQLAQDFLDENF